MICGGDGLHDGGVGELWVNRGGRELCVSCG